MNDFDIDADEKTEEQYQYEREQIEQYEYEREQIEQMFPNAKFEIAINFEELDEVVTDLSNIVIKILMTVIVMMRVKEIQIIFT